MTSNALPKMEYEFTIDLKGEESKQKYSGTFRYKRPNLRIATEIDKTRALLNGGITGLSTDTKDLHEILAILRHTLVEYPDWWEECDFGFELYDLNVVLDIYKETREFEADFEDKLHGEDKTAKGDESQDKSKKAGKGKAEAEG